MDLRRHLTVADALFAAEMAEGSWASAQSLLRLVGRSHQFDEGDTTYRADMVALQTRAVDFENVARRFWDVR